jgi:hypothetical protein
LILQVFEIGRDRKPRWAAAQEKLRKLTDDQLVKGLELGLQDKYEEFYENRAEAVAAARARAANGLKAVRSMWNEEWRISARVRLRRSDVLIVGDRTWGDPPYEEYEDVEVARALGLPAAAGFWEEGA